MAIIHALLPEFDQEMGGVQRTLERIPEDKFTWKPHPKSPTLAWLAGHLANLPTWATLTLTQDSFDMAPEGKPLPKQPEPVTRKEVLDTFAKNRDAARAAIAAASDADLMKNWTLLQGGKTLMTLPRVAVVRTFVLNHMVHHRAQLGVYLRLNDVPVPAIYGPSADENPF
ncbi:MAG TPA: DinB family protein [Candidatus Acidoferrales bacterium]